MLAELADRLEEADKLTDCGMPFTSALSLQTGDEPQTRWLTCSFLSVPVSVFFLVCIPFIRLTEGVSMIYKLHLFPLQETEKERRIGDATLPHLTAWIEPSSCLSTLY